MNEYIHSKEDHEAIQEYKNAVWSFIIEHCEVLPSGKLFVKFHMDNQANFEKRVWARYKYKYHREDWENKEMTAEEQREKFLKEKEDKKNRYMEEKRIRRAEINYQVKLLDWSNWYKKTQEGAFMTRMWGIMAATIWNRKPRK